MKLARQVKRKPIDKSTSKMVLEVGKSLKSNKYVHFELDVHSHPFRLERALKAMGYRVDSNWANMDFCIYFTVSKGEPV